MMPNGINREYYVYEPLNLNMTSNNPILFNDFICDFCDWDEEILTINSLSGDWSN